MATPSFFLISKVNPRGKKQDRIIEINTQSRSLLNRDPEDNKVLKEFPLKTVADTELSTDEKILTIKFSDIKQHPYIIEFTSPGERVMFSEKLQEAIGQEVKLLAQTAHLQTVFKVVKVNVRGSKQERFLGLDVDKKTIMNFTPDNKLNKTIKIDTVKGMEANEKCDLIIHFKKMHDYIIFFESESERDLFHSKIKDIRDGKAVSNTETPDASTQDKKAETELPQVSAVSISSDVNQAEPSEGNSEKVSKVNKRGKKQERVIVLNQAEKTMKNLDLNDQLKKEFSIKDIKSVEPVGDSEVLVSFVPKKLNPYSMIFSSKGERNLFVSSFNDI